ncbi:MAG: amidohydrolase [Clostridiaceae bacterium]|nr:amidohydrolase [Clostridiaceae bacterium]
MYKKMDFHVHYLTTSYREFLMEHYGPEPEHFKTPEWGMEKQLKMMKENEIEYALLGISSPYFCCKDTAKTIEAVRKNNDEIAEMLTGHEDRLGYLAALPLPDVDHSLEEIERALLKGAKGFSVNTHLDGIYLGNPALDPVMEEMNRQKSIVHIHPTQPARVPEGVCNGFPIPAMEFFFDTTRTFINMCLNHVFERYSDIRFIFSHAGALVPILSDRLDVFFRRYKDDRPDLDFALKQAYFDLAGYVEPRQLELILEVALAGHLLYGSDFPHTGTMTVAKNAKALEYTKKLSAEQKEMIFFENGKKLLCG